MRVNRTWTTFVLAFWKVHGLSGDVTPELRNWPPF
jgi:hypothetical protein